MRTSQIRKATTEALQASPGYGEVLAAALAPKHEAIIRPLPDGKSYRVRCSCQPRGTGSVVRGRSAAEQAAYHIVDSHN